MSAPVGVARRPGPARLLSFGGLLVGTGLALVAAAQPWWRARGDGLSVAFSGTQATAGLGQALALVVLAGSLLALALRARGRRLLAVLLAVAGVGVVVLGALRPRPSGDAVRTQVREVSLAEQFALDGTAWPWVYAVAGLVVLLGALTMLVTAPRWVGRADRFDPAATATGRTTRPPAGELDLSDPVAAWRAMDAGVDPTDDGAGPDVAPEVRTDARTDVPTGASSGADVRESSPGDTMDPVQQGRQAK